MKEEHCHWNVEVVATAKGMMDDGGQCSASIFGATTILA
jgi:hypothetical protein